MNLPFDENNSFTCNYFEADGDQYAFVGFIPVGNKAIDTIDEFRSLTTNEKYSVHRRVLIQRMIEKKACAIKI
jgi:hypothetical protein